MNDIFDFLIIPQINFEIFFFTIKLWVAYEIELFLVKKKNRRDHR